MSTLNQATGPLALGWHRITWTSLGKRQWTVTRSASSAALLQVALRNEEDVRFESWSDYTYDPEIGGYRPDVPRETLRRA